MAIPVLLDSADRLTDCIYFGDRLASGGAVPSSRIINTGYGLTGGGDLSVNRTFSVTPVVNGYNVMAFGAVADGAFDNTAVYDTIFGQAPSGVLVFPPGRYAGTIQYPATPDDRTSNWSVMGAGINETFLIAASPDTPVITKFDRTGVTQGVTVGGFTVVAHASGSTGPAIDMAGFRFCEFHHLGYASNSGGDFASMFHFSAAEMRCYGNKVHHVVIDGGTVQNTGPATVILFDNKDDAGVDQGLAFNANDHELSFIEVYSNTGISTAIDALRSAAVRIHDCFFESNSGCTYVIPGSNCQVFNNHFESGVTTDTIKYDSVPDQGTGNDTFVYGNEFSDMAVLNFPSTVVNNTWIQNLFDVACTVTDLGTNNIIYRGGTAVVGNPISIHQGSFGDVPSVSSTNLGAGGAAILLTGSNDQDGIIELDFGTTVPDKKGIVTFTFALVYLNDPAIIVCPAAGPPSPGTVWSAPVAGTVAFQVGDISNSGFTILWENGSVPSNNAKLRINYHVKGLPN